MPVTAAQGAIWAISAVATGGVIVRPWRLPEAIWAMLGAAALVLLALLPWRDALRAVGKGTDVYLFLIGMMLLAELARKEGLSTGSRPWPRGARKVRPRRCSRSSIRWAFSSPCSCRTMRPQ